MKKKQKETGIIVLFIVFFPYLCGVFFHKIEPEGIEPVEKGTYKVQVVQNAGVETLPLEEYIRGVLPTVIPISYEMETLKAQAVVLRTDILKQYLEQGTGNKTLKGDSLHYSYLDIPARETLWKEEFAKNQIKIETAVADTKDMVLTYEGIPMEVPFFAVSAGTTRNAEEVLGSRQYPYLVSVACSVDILAEEYQQKIVFSASELKEKLNIQELEINNFEIKKRDSQGYVLEVTCLDTLINGEDLRKKLELPSANFKVEKSNKAICFITNGVGHGLGMSQYGANKMALNQKTFLEILPYFYTGAEIQKQ